MEIILSALAEAIIGLLIDDLAQRPKLRSVRNRLAGESPEKLALQRALATAYVAFDTKFISLSSGFFDKHFLESPRVVQELTKLLTPNKKPNPLIIVEEWKSQFAFEPNIDIAEPVSYFLTTLEEETKSEPLLKPFVDSRALEQLYSIAQTSAEKQKLQIETNTILEDIRHLLLSNVNSHVSSRAISEAESKVVHNLPNPDYTTFIGRETELNDIQKRLRPFPHSRYHIIVIDGIGGIGKSTLALETAYLYARRQNKYSDDENFEAIFWTSAKKTILTGDGIKPRIQSFENLHGILGNLMLVMGWEKPIEDSQVSDFVVKKLTESKVLIVIDNLETVDDEYILSFLLELPPPTKAIVTTRHRIDVAYPIRLRGMPLADARILIDQEATEKNVVLSDENIRLLYERTGGVPLAMVWSIAKMGFGYGISNVLSKLGEPSNDVSKFCFEQSVEVIRNKPAYSILLALASSEVGASRSWISQVTNLPLFDLEDGLVDLEKLSLINKDGDYFSMLPLTLAYCQIELEGDNAQARSVREQVPIVKQSLNQEALSKYYSYLNSTYGRLRIFGTNNSFKLQELYIDVEVVMTPEKSEKHSPVSQEEASIQEQPRATRLSGIEVVQKYQYLFVLGQAGSGKTMFFKHLALEAIQNDSIKKTPIFVPIRELSQSGLRLTDFLTRELNIGGFSDTQSFIQESLQRGNLLLLFDGLDEIADAERRKVISAITNLQRLYPNNQFVISSRTISASYVLNNFSYIEIADFSPNQIETYVTRRFNNENKTEVFIKAIHSNPNLLELARSPLILTLICTVFEMQNRLPLRRFELYSDSAELMLRNWDSMRSIALDDYHQLSLQEMRSLLSCIAIRIQRDGNHLVNGMDLVLAIEKILLDSSVLATKEMSFRVLSYLTERTGLIVERNHQTYSFVHLVFQEFFAAAYLAEHLSELESDMADNLDNPQWSEVFLLVAGMLREPELFFVLGINLIGEMSSTSEKFLYVKSLLLEALEMAFVKDKERIRYAINGTK